MSLVKVPYTDDETIIHASNLNDIQDEIIRTENEITYECVTGSAKEFTTAKKNNARSTIGIPEVSSGNSIALADLQGTVIKTF